MSIIEGWRERQRKGEMNLQWIVRTVVTCFLGDLCTNHNARYSKISIPGKRGISRNI